jgi:outer membrane protein OmpA-like peptidoglycan-associated protein/ABC-type nitrate/sulfonate/bicarbonate transport system substrate-binding protein
MAERSRRGVLMAAVTWLILIAMAAAAYRYFLHPTVKRRAKLQTGSDSRYSDEIRVALDSFSGYCVLRSPALRDRLARQGVRLSLLDDEADYPARIRSLKDGDTDMAVFTVDSLISSGADLGDYPATIVLVLDETRGADAIVARKDGPAALQDLNDPAARFVLTPASPSEFLARVAIAHFSLPRLPSKWMVEARGAGEVYSALLAGQAGEKKAYVLWEPYVSRAIDEGARVLLDTSRLQGYILDVLVARRSFLQEKPDRVRLLVESYLRVLYETTRSNGMVDLVSRDARETGLGGLTKTQAERLVAGIQWKNTLENYAHFGLLRESEAKGLTHLEDAIDQIAEVLVKTGALREDPVRGEANTLYHKNVLRELKTANFHPARELSVISGTGVETDGAEEVRGSAELPALGDDQWARLVTVGEMRIPPVAFARGTARLNLESTRNLSQLVQQLRAFPSYYLTVEGNVRAEGDAEANLQLARERAEAVTSFLAAEGVQTQRVRARAAPPRQAGGEAQSVTFLVGQTPY